jgi:hypothetical protein
MTPVELVEFKIKQMLEEPTQERWGSPKYYEHTLILLIVDAIQCSMMNDTLEARLDVEANFIDSWEEFYTANPANSSKEVAKRVLQFLAAVSPELVESLKSTQYLSVN